jgi:chromosomal replication initiation ATPase DnaA
MRNVNTSHAHDLVKSYDLNAFRVDGQIKAEYHAQSLAVRNHCDIDASIFCQVKNKIVQSGFVCADILAGVSFVAVDESIETIFLAVPDTIAKQLLDQESVKRPILSALHEVNKYIRHLICVLRDDQDTQDDIFNPAVLAKKEIPFAAQLMEQIAFDGNARSAAEAYLQMSEYGSRFLITSGYCNMAIQLSHILRKEFVEDGDRCFCICGPAQSGKTQLLLSLGTSMLARKDRKVLYRNFDSLCKEATEKRESDCNGEYLAYKAQFAGSNLLIDDIYEYTICPDTRAVYDIIRTVIYSGGRIIVTMRDMKMSDFFKDISVFHPNCVPQIIELPTPPRKHCTTVMRSKIAYANMTINEKQFHAISSFAELGNIMHAAQLAQLLVRVNNDLSGVIHQFVFSGQDISDLPTEEARIYTYDLSNNITEENK